MSRRDFGRGFAVAVPAVVAGGLADRHLGGMATLERSVPGVVHGRGGHFGVLGTAEDPESFGVYGYAAGAGGSALGGGAAEPGSYGAQLGVSGADSFGVRSEATGERSTAVVGEAHADGSVGVHGAALGHNSAGIYAESSPALESSHALWAEGRSHVNGQLSHSVAGFRIDHPLEPGTRFLAHSVVESSERKNVYDGMVRLDAAGRAEVELPRWFEAVNRDARYQLTAIGRPAPELHVAEETHGNRFVIAGGHPHMRVSWMVTGVRRDPAAEADPLVVEAAKPAEHAGAFLRPELHGSARALQPRPARRVPTSERP